MSSEGALQEGRDFIIEAESGLLVFTAFYLAQRGYCCSKGCRHCPYVPRHGGRPAQLPELGAHSFPTKPQ